MRAVRVRGDVGHFVAHGRPLAARRHHLRALLAADARASPRTRPRTSCRTAGAGRGRGCRSSRPPSAPPSPARRVRGPARRGAPRPIRRARSDAAFSRAIGSPSGQAFGSPARAILAGIVRGRMAFGAIGEMLDQRRPLIGPRALGRPVRRGIDRQRIVAVDPQPGDAIADRARREGRRLGAGEAREAARSPIGC